MKPLFILLHTLAIVTVITNLLTGLRIAILEFDYLHFISPLLPQGLVHPLHILSAIFLTLTAVTYLVYLGLNQTSKKPTHLFHRAVIYCGYALLLLMILSGWLNFFGSSPIAFIHKLHYYGALLIIVYLFMHGWVYFARFGVRVFKDIFIVKVKINRIGLVSSVAVMVLSGYFFETLNKSDINTLIVKKTDDSLFINIDGIADETIWQTTDAVTVNTFGGENFVNGASKISIKALHNNEEIYFYVSWQDNSQSLQHLPLIKGKKRWHVQGNDFYQFNEKAFYEDKLALMFSKNCRLGASGTAHLGKKPLANKPENFHGKGYHYSDDKQVHDVWQWKAVRTNEMYLADDNFFAQPKKALTAQRRYTAGYQTDGKESGAYVMNWDWYSPHGVIPKRLPLLAEQLAPFQHPSANASWVSPWFEFQPYGKALDQYPEGTVMPSVLYNSNKMEGDRADVRAFGRWQDNYWHLEMVRKLDTGSAFDLPIEDGLCLWLAAFDHAQIAHTRHNIPLTLELSND